MIQSKSALVPQLHPSRPGPTSPLLADLHMLSHAFAGRSLEKVSRGAALLPPMAIKRTIFGEPVFCQPQPTQGWDLGLRLFSQLLVKDLPNLLTSSSAYQCPSPHPPRQTLFLPSWEANAQGSGAAPHLRTSTSSHHLRQLRSNKAHITQGSEELFILFVHHLTHSDMADILAADHQSSIVVPVGAAIRPFHQEWTGRAIILHQRANLTSTRSKKTRV